MSDEDFQIVTAPPWSRRSYYLRRRPYTYKKPTRRQAAQRAQFGRIAFDQFDKTGYVKRPDGAVLPPAAAAIQDLFVPVGRERKTVTITERVRRALVEAMIKHGIFEVVAPVEAPVPEKRVEILTKA